MSDQKSILLAELVADTAKAQNTDYLAADVQLSRDDGFLRITVVAQTAVKIRLVPSTGSAFYINAGTALAANSVHVEDVPVDADRTWNVQTDDISGATISILRLQEIAGVS
jgi:ActR/RegA family two-component response regulator